MDFPANSYNIRQVNIFINVIIFTICAFLHYSRIYSAISRSLSPQCSKK